MGRDGDPKTDYMDGDAAGGCGGGMGLRGERRAEMKKVGEILLAVVILGGIAVPILVLEIFVVWKTMIYLWKTGFFY